MRLFFWLDVETSSLCNRVCATCIRNSNPNQEEVRDWFQQHLMPMDTVRQILDQAAALGFRGRLVLSHFNEPLMDPRIVDIARLARSYDQFNVALVTNGDFLTEDIAKGLDESLDRIIVSLYLPRGKARTRRKEWIRSLFHRTVPSIKGYHEITHFSPLGTDMQDVPCTHLARLIINHRGQYLLCCDDMIGHFDLGTFPELSLADYWYGEKRISLKRKLSEPGGRRFHPYCASCPRL